MFATVTFYGADAATIKQTMDGGVDVTITYPDAVIVGRDFTVSALVQNNGWEDKQDIKFALTSPDDSILVNNGTLVINRLSTGGSYGGTIDLKSADGIPLGTHYLNAVYSQILLSHNETPLPATQKNIAIPIEIKNLPEVQINTATPESIFPNAEFPFDVEVISKDIDIQNVLVEIKSPSDISFRGQTTHTFSTIAKNTPLPIHSQIVTNESEVTLEHKLPFEVSVKYTDDTGTERTISKTVSLLLRPRTLMEFTTDGGVWIGGFFLAPYVSLGTLIGIPGGALFSLLIRRLQKKNNRKRKK
ncbi:MAG: hypothetical protein EPO62_00545 [Candidatus Nitrosotenuis sp.]|nr:MAG: hypothetical protein EPO62_00545 [Candidatus Nitrosotenuis sp.]